VTGKLRAKALYATCQHMSLQGRPYLYGGGHTKPLAQIKVTDGLDCSGSVCLSLKRVGLYAPAYATTAQGLMTWGVAGKGKYFTVWCKGGAKGQAHTWIQFHGLGRVWRFDTSAWGSGGRGPRMRILPRPTAGFTPRHWPGL
jgi:hypothetical protein